MKSVTVSDFRLNLTAYINVARSEPVTITGDDKSHQAVLVSPEFYERAIRALNEQSAAQGGRGEGVEAGDKSGVLPINDLFDELGI